MDIPTQAIRSTADFSECMRYRYSLVREFSGGKDKINFIMLNPSTANEQFNDPTVARCENRAIEYGYQYMIVTNVFAFRATDPKDMRAAQDPIGYRKNDEAIVKYAKESAMVVCAWGEHAAHLGRSAEVKALLRKANIQPRILRLNKSGEPAHPLYLPKALEPSLWDISLSQT